MELVIGVVGVAFGVVAIVFRRRFVDWRVTWHEQNFPTVPISRSIEMVGYLIGTIIFIAAGIGFVVLALTQ